MNTAIIYFSHHGAVEKCANLLKEKLSGEVTLINLKTEKKPNISNAEKIIIGCSVHAGNIPGKVKKFCTSLDGETLKKKLGIFISTLAPPEKSDEYYQKNFSAILGSNVDVKAFVGGEVYFDRMNFFEKFLMKKITGTDQNIYKLNMENIDAFAKEMTK